MSYVSDVRDFCGDYAIDIKYHEGQKEAITLFFNSRRNAETVKRCIEVDDSVPNVATAVDFVEVVRCKDCAYYREETSCCLNPHCVVYYYGHRVKEDHYCSYGERSENGKGNHN